MKSDAILEVVGIIPAGGKASRISPLPCSKELLPVGFRTLADGSRRPKAVSHYLLDKFAAASVSRVYFILRRGKWDIPSYYGDGSMTGMPLAYLMMNLPHGVPYTVDQAYPFVGEAKVMIGFPDILFGPADAFVQADKTLAAKGADMVLGLYPVKDAAQTRKCDMVKWDAASGRIEEIVIKPEQSTFEFSWIFAVWRPRFTHFMHEYLQKEKIERHQDPARQEIHLGHVVRQAIGAGLKVCGHVFPGQRFLDIGTPEDLAEAWKLKIPESAMVLELSDGSDRSV